MHLATTQKLLLPVPLHPRCPLALDSSRRPYGDLYIPLLMFGLVTTGLLIWRPKNLLWRIANIYTTDCDVENCNSK